MCSTESLFGTRTLEYVNFSDGSLRQEEKPDQLYPILKVRHRLATEILGFSEGA